MQPMKAHEEKGEVPVMITKHCRRFAFNLCPKQAKGNIKSWKATPMQLVNGDEVLTLKFRSPTVRNARNRQDEAPHSEDAVAGQRRGFGQSRRTDEDTAEAQRLIVSSDVYRVCVIFASDGARHDRRRILPPSLEVHRCRPCVVVNDRHPAPEDIHVPD